MQDVKKETPPATPGTAAQKAQSPQPGSFCLAHISDLHLTSLHNTRINQLLNKRLLGYLSWWRKRRVVHRLDIVESLLKDLETLNPEHIAVTGDLTHLGLPEEFKEAAQWLPRLGPPDRVTVIPGNHEAYAGGQWAQNLSAWGPYLLSDDQQSPKRPGDFFPSLRVRGQVAIIGLCSARPSLPFLAIGSLGKKQLHETARLLKETGEAGLLRVIMVHHPPLPGITKWRKRLVDGEDFADIVRRYGAELVLHGHTHASTFREMQGPSGMIPVVGAPSASELNPHAERCGGYDLYRIERNGSHWKVTMFVRRYSEKLSTFDEEQQITLNIPQP